MAQADTATDTDTDTDTASSGASHGQEAHQPTPRDYIRIAAVLAVLTAMEFSTYFFEFGALSLPLLLTLMSIKFGLIVGVFMHLKYDTKMFTRLMMGGLTAAGVLYTSDAADDLL